MTPRSYGQRCRRKKEIILYSGTNIRVSYTLFMNDMKNLEVTGMNLNDKEFANRRYEDRLNEWDHYPVEEPVG